MTRAYRICGCHQADRHTHCGGAGRREKEAEKIYEEIMTKDLPNLTKDININQEPQQTPGKMNSERSTLRHIMKLFKNKDKERI